MPEIRTIISWKAHTDPKLSPTDRHILVTISFAQAQADCAILSRDEIAQSARIRPDNVLRHTKALRKAGYLNISNIKGSRSKRYEVPSVTARNREAYWAKQKAQAEAADRRELEQKLAAHNRSKLAVIAPKTAASDTP